MPPDALACGHCSWTASSRVRRCSWISVVPSSSASIGPVTVSTVAIGRQSMRGQPAQVSLITAITIEAMRQTIRTTIM